MATKNHAISYEVISILKMAIKLKLCTKNASLQMHHLQICDLCKLLLLKYCLVVNSFRESYICAFTFGCAHFFKAISS